MPRIRFTADYDYKPKPGVTIGYKAGWSGLVHGACAEQAIKLGKAEAVPFVKPPSDLAETLGARRYGKRRSI